MNKQRMRWMLGLAPLMVAGSLAAASFEPLFRVVTPKGSCEVLVPGTSGYVPAQKGKAYPYGTSIRCGENGSAVILLSAKDAVQLEANTAAELLDDPGSRECKILRLHAGRLNTRLSNDLPETALTIETPLAAGYALGGTVKFGMATTAEGATLTAQADSSSTVKIVGPQFIIPALANGAGARITTVPDNSFTRIENLQGEYPIMINRGTDERAPAEVDGMPNQDLLNVETSKRAAVKIWRSRAPLGGTLIVSSMITDSKGKVKETFAFAVGKPSLGSRTIFTDLESDASTNAVESADGPQEEHAQEDASVVDVFQMDAPGEEDAIRADAPAADAPKAQEAAPAATGSPSFEDLFF